MIFGRTTYPVQRLPVVIPIGVQTETGVEEIGFDVSAWVKKWPDMEVTVWHRLPGQADAYLCKSRREGDILYWEVTDTDTQTPGTGRVELMGTTATGRKLSGNTATRIRDTIAATTQDPPLAPPTWVETVQEMIRQSGGGPAGAKGDKGDTGATGAKGADGVSPTVTVSKSGKVTTVTIKDAEGTKTATINDGADGEGGVKTVNGVEPDESGNVVISTAETVQGYVVAEAERVAEKILGITGQAAAPGSAGYINQLPVSINSDGSVYNGTGYKIGYRLNSSGEEKQITESYYDTAVCVTGFIPCAAGDIIRVAGMVIDPSDIQAGAYNIAVYDVNFDKVGYVNWATAANNVTITLGNDGYVASIALAGTFNIPSVAYIRLSAKNITADSVATVNEEIKEGITVDTGRVPFSMAFLTDIHWADPDKPRMISAAQALAEINKTASLDVAVFGGDYINNWSTVSVADAKEDIANSRKVFADVVTAPSLWLRGNHDNNPYPDVRLTKAEIFNRIGRQQHTQAGYVSNWDDPYGGYGYIDFGNAKIRVVAVNTSDNDQFGAAAMNGTYSALLDAYHISGAQLQWIADHALDFSEKETPTEWGVIFVSHVPIYSENTWYNSHAYTDADGNAWDCNVINLAELVKAYADKTSFSATVNGVTVEKDFSSVAETAKVICFVNGHKHALLTTTYNGLTFISCPNACNNGEKASDDGTTYTKGRSGTAEETAFTVLTIDIANEKVYAWIYGAGYDREISLDL